MAVTTKSVLIKDRWRESLTNSRYGENVIGCATLLKISTVRENRDTSDGVGRHAAELLNR